MPSKETYLIYFLSMSLILTLMQVFVYQWLKALLKKDFPIRSKRWLRSVRWAFILMNIPIAYLFFRKQIPYDLSTLTKIMFYPFTIWQGVIIIWTIILIPVSIYTLGKKTVRNLRGRLRVE